MNPQEMAAEGLKLIKESVFLYTQQHKGGVRQVAVAKDLGLELGADTFTRVLAREMLRQLVDEKRIRVDRKGKATLYFTGA